MITSSYRLSSSPYVCSGHFIASNKNTAKCWGNAAGKKPYDHSDFVG